MEFFIWYGAICAAFICGFFTCAILATGKASDHNDERIDG